MDSNSLVVLLFTGNLVVNNGSQSSPLEGSFVVVVHCTVTRHRSPLSGPSFGPSDSSTIVMFSTLDYVLLILLTYDQK